MMIIPRTGRARALALLGPLAGLALLATACSSGSSTTGSTAPASSAATSGGAYGGSSATTAGSATATGGTGSSSGATVAVSSSTDLGPILVDGEGRTLYLFEKDTGTESTCNDACATAWPPLTTAGQPQGSGDTQTSLLGTTSRNDGTTQVTYNGHPLYRYQGDSQAGDTNGEAIDAFGAEWYVVSPSGQKVEKGGS
jgi:predicted lipoprotein with Yx(FWY)xxD motif